MDMHNVHWEGWQAVRPLGCHATASVWEIQRSVHGRAESAALKVIPIPSDDSQIQAMRSRGDDPEAIRQFFHRRMEETARACAVMLDMRGHANVVHCDDIRCEPHSDGIGWDLYIKMEMLTPLPAVFPKGAPEEWVLRLGADVAAAAALCAQRGIVHEAIKPENVFMTPDGGFKLGDLGQAKASGMPCGGDLRCMSPEVYWGMAYDSRTDVYALGILLYTLLNEGCLPLTGPGASEEAVRDACIRRLSGEALPLPKNGSDALRQIVMRACAYEPARRYESAEQLRLALAELGAASGLVLTAPVAAVPQQQAGGSQTYRPSVAPEEWQTQPEPQTERPPEPVKKKKSGVLFLLIAVLSAVLVAAVVCFFTVHIWPEVSCNELPQCVICGKTGEKAPDHSWQKATCTKAETCAVCGESKGEPLGHQWIAATRETAATCSVCGQTEGGVLRPTLWIMKLISSGWQGGHQQTLEGQTVSVAFPEDKDFLSCQVTVSQVDGTEVTDGFAVEWEEGTVKLTAAETLKPGVYYIQFQTDAAGAMLTVCYGYEGEEYISSAEHFWSGNSWCSDAHGTYLLVENGTVALTDQAVKATVFGSAREMLGVVKDASGKLQPTGQDPVELSCMTYFRDGQDGLVVFAYEGWYLACDSQGSVYMTQQLDENCFWVEGR